MASRIKNLAKLGILLGGPIALLVGLFSCGVYVGHEHRETVLAFERDWLGMDVVVPGRPVPPKTEPKVEPPKTEPPKTEPKVEPPKTEPPKTEPKTEPPKTEPPKTEPTPVPPVLARVEDPLPLTLPEPAPLSGDAATRLAEPVRVSVKVLVDPGLATRRPDWLAYVQRHVAWASQVYEKQIGLAIDLQGIVRVPAPVRSLADLTDYGHDGADVLLVFTNEAFSVPVTIARRDPGTNLDAMLVHATQGSRAGHLRGLLLALGLVLGAEVVADDSEDAQAGTWMSGAAVRSDDARPIKLDATNRMTMLAHKTFAFASATPARPEPGAPPTVHDEPEAPADQEQEKEAR